jgi:uncharacterized protein (DUF305 family)
MRTPSRWAIAFTLLFALALQGAQEAGHPTHAVSISTADPAWTELTSSMEKMHQAMSSVAPSDDSDRDFVRLMLPHHQAAIDMAKSELLFGKSPEMRRLAQEIITDQQSEIQLMQLWLKKHTPGRQQSRPSSDSDRKEN